LSVYWQATHPTIEALLHHLEVQSRVLSGPFDAARDENSYLADHLRTCSLCSKRLAYLQRELSTAENVFLETAEALTFEKDYVPADNSSQNWLGLGKLIPRYVSHTALGVLAVCFVGLAVFGIDLATQPKFYHHARLEMNEFTDVLYVHRGAPEPQADEEIYATGRLVAQGDFKQAQQRLSNIEPAGLDRSNLYRLTLLDLIITMKLVDRSTLDLFHSFDRAQIHELTARSEARLIEITQQPQPIVPQYANTVRYLLAKAYLMVEDVGGACKHLELATSTPHRHFKESQQIRKAVRCSPETNGFKGDS